MSPERRRGCWRRLSALAVVCAGVALGCGDKLMLLLGSARYRQISGGRPVNILVYAHSESSVSGIVREFELQSALKRSGHKLRAVDDPARFEAALRDGKYDLVMADVSDAGAVTQQLRSASFKPTLLPVIYKATKAEEKAVARKYHCVLKVPGSPDRYLKAIDDALELRLGGGKSKE